MLIGTLQRHRLGAHADGIAVIFLASACVSVIVSPLVGRWSDGRGRRVPIRIGLVLGGALLVVLALIESLWVAIVAVVVALVALRAYWGPALAMLSEASDTRTSARCGGRRSFSSTATTRFIVDRARAAP
jgi:MFS family permease